MLILNNDKLNKLFKIKNLSDLFYTMVSFINFIYVPLLEILHLKDYFVFQVELQAFVKGATDNIKIYFPTGTSNCKF